jgi:hypothetical protein
VAALHHVEVPHFKNAQGQQAAGKEHGLQWKQRQARKGERSLGGHGYVRKVPLALFCIGLLAIYLMNSKLFNTAKR